MPPRPSRRSTRQAPSSVPAGSSAAGSTAPSTWMATPASSGAASGGGQEQGFDFAAQRRVGRRKRAPGRRRALPWASRVPHAGPPRSAPSAPPPVRSCRFPCCPRRFTNRHSRRQLARQPRLAPIPSRARPCARPAQDLRRSRGRYTPEIAALAPPRRAAAQSGRDAPAPRAPRARDPSSSTCSVLGVLQRYALRLAAALAPRCARVIDQQMPHGDRGDAQEVSLRLEAVAAPTGCR